MENLPFYGEDSSNTTRGKNDAVIELALSLDGKGLAAQKQILVQLFGAEDLGNKRQYKLLAIQLHPDKNTSRQKDATQAMQLFLSAMDAQIAAHEGVPFMDKVAVERVKLGVRLLGKEVTLKDAGPWSSVPMKLVDFNEESLRFKACVPSGCMWTGVVAILPEDAQANKVVRISPNEVVKDWSSLTVDAGYGSRVSKELIGKMKWTPHAFAHCSLMFTDFGPQMTIPAPKGMEHLELKESMFLMFDQTFTSRLERGSSSSSTLQRVEAEILEVVPPEVKNCLINNALIELALVRIINPFDADDALSIGNISDDLVQSFVIRQRLGPEKVLALETEAREKLMMLEDAQSTQAGADGKEGSPTSGGREGSDEQARSNDPSSWVLKIADEVDSIIIAQDKHNFQGTAGTGVLHQQEDKQDACWYEFNEPQNAKDSLRRLIGVGGMVRSGITPHERLLFVCVHPRTNKLMETTDEYLISVHAAAGADFRSASQERINSKKMDDLILKGVVVKCDAQKKVQLSLHNEASSDTQGDRINSSQQSGSAGNGLANDDEAMKQQETVREFVGLVREFLGKEISAEQAMKKLRSYGWNKDMALSSFM